MNRHCVVVYYKDEPTKVKYVLSGFKFKQHAEAIAATFEKSIVAEQIKC